MDDDAVAMRLTQEQRLDWLRLIRSENVGARTFRALVNHCGGARAALDALPELARRGGAARPIKVCSRAEAEREMADCHARGITLVALGEREYPRRLLVLEDAPPLLAVRGDVETLGRPMVAVVGSRNASAAGLRTAEFFSRDLAQAGYVVVSGLARGIDAAAHRVTARTGTVAVLAGGHARVYPSENVPLLDQIVDGGQGAAVSEMPLHWEPRGRDFPRRNRIISGLSLGVLVVEAARRSGSLITARFALEQGREVFAVPGSPLDPRADGTNGLIKQGATLVTEASDITTVLDPILDRREDVSAQEPSDESVGPLTVTSAQPEPDEGTRSRILALLGPTPITLDTLVRVSNFSVAAVRTALLELEIAGRLDRLGGGKVALAFPSDQARGP